VADRRKSNLIILVSAAVLVIVGLATCVVLLASSKHSATAKKTVDSVKTSTISTPPDTSQYKLASCKSGTTQTLGNAGYVVGTDLAPGKYTVRDALQSADNGTGWTNVDVYAKQSDYKGQNDGNAADYIQPNVGETASTLLKDGEYVNVWADDAVFTCQ
jgi:cytoskeletal protein RodZ